MVPSPSEELLTFEETCERMGISASALDTRIRQGLLTGRKIGRRRYFSSQQVNHLARFTLTATMATRQLGMGLDELMAWAASRRVQVITVGNRRYFAADDIAAIKALRMRFNIRVTEAAERSGLGLTLLRRRVRDGTLHSLRVSVYCYVIWAEVEELAVTTATSYSVGPAAKRLGISVSWLRRLADRDVIRHSRTKGGQLRFHEADIRLYKAERKAVAKKAQKKGR